MSNQTNTSIPKIHINYMDFGHQPGITAFRLGKYLEEFKIEYLDEYLYYSPNDDVPLHTRNKISTIEIRTSNDVYIVLESGCSIVITFEALAKRYKVKGNTLISYSFTSKEEHQRAQAYPI
jgi:hypothetical protein